MPPSLQRLTVAAVLMILAAAQVSGQAAGRRQFGIQVGRGLAVAPLGDVAESFGIYAIPGYDYEARLVTRSARGNEWSVGALADEYEIDHIVDSHTRSRFAYSSVALVVARSWTQDLTHLWLQYGFEAGWRRFDAESSRPDVYTGALAESRTSGNAALFAVSFALELPGWYGTLQPRLRLETNFPDFGGGDGFSVVHRETDLGFRASLGLNFKTFVGRQR